MAIRLGVQDQGCRQRSVSQLTWSRRRGPPTSRLRRWCQAGFSERGGRCRRPRGREGMWAKSGIGKREASQAAKSCAPPVMAIAAPGHNDIVGVRSSPPCLVDESAPLARARFCFVHRADRCPLHGVHRVSRRDQRAHAIPTGWVNIMRWTSGISVASCKHPIATATGVMKVLPGAPDCSGGDARAAPRVHSVSRCHRAVARPPTTATTLKLGAGVRRPDRAGPVPSRPRLSVQVRCWS